MIQLQCTLFSNQGYKPMSTVVSVESVQYYNEHAQEVKTQAIQKICIQRHMNKYHLIEYGYTKIKVRRYEPEDKSTNDKQRGKSVVVV